MNYSFSSILPIFFAPFIAFVINAFLSKKLPRQGDFIAIAGSLVSFLYSFAIFKDFIFEKHNTDFLVHKVFPWIDISTTAFPFTINMGVYIDNMAAIMLLMVSGVATLILIFSTYYMKGDSRYGKFFVLMSLFISAMLGLVLSENLLSLFVFWEIMGFCSYSLIGFYAEKHKAGNASIKAFMTTRVGDVFLFLGIIAIWSVVGSVGYADIYAAIANGSFEGKAVFGISLATFASFCLFAGTIGKSAQFPLQVWLPDAMMGPTPCSALIHAATMVAAGVFLSLRMFPLMEMAGITPFIAIIGAITAFGAATIALVQTDIKAVLAFSTISQLGYMVLGIGVGSYSAAFMHLITHAIFKACLFLSAGSVIHSLHDPKTHEHVQDMTRMGGLRKKLPITFLAMLLCTLAITGVPFFSGFVSKDRILGDALFWGGQGLLYPIVPILGFLGAILTAFYMFRMMFLTFWGRPRDRAVFDHCHRERFSFNRGLPLLLLSVFTLGVFFSGSLSGQGIVKVFSKKQFEWFKVLVAPPDLKRFAVSETANANNSFEEMSPSLYEGQSGYYGLGLENEKGIHSAHIIGAILSLIIVFLGVFLAVQIYLRRKISSKTFVSAFPRFNKCLLNRYFFDDFYLKVVIEKGLLRVNRGLSLFDLSFLDKILVDGWVFVNRFFYRIIKKIDEVFIDLGLVDGSGFFINILSLILRVFQTGRIQFYIMVFIIGLGGYALISIF